MRATRKDGGTRKQRIRKRRLPIAPTHHAGLATIPSSLPRVGSLRRLDSLCPWDLDQTTGERNCCTVGVAAGEILGPKKREFPLRRRDVLVQDVLPTAAQRYDVAVSELEEQLRVRDIHGLEKLVSSCNEMGHACIQYLRVCFASGSLGPGQAGTLISGLRRFALLARSCGVYIEVGPSPSLPSSEEHWSLMKSC